MEQGFLTIGAWAASCIVALWTVLAMRRRLAMSQIARALQAVGEGRPTHAIRGFFLGEFGKVVRVVNELTSEQAQRAVRVETERVLSESVLRGMSEGVIAVDSRRRLVFANPVACELFGITLNDMGRLLAEVLRHPQIHEVVEATALSGQLHRAEVNLAAPRHDESRTLAVHAQPTPGSPDPGTVLVFHDITGLRRLERMRQDFVANVSHELKTPLSSIKAYAETLREGAVDDPEVNRLYLRQIEEQADRLDQLVREMLKLSRLERGQEVFRHTPMAIMPQVRRIVDSHRAHASSKGVSLLLRPGNADETTLVRIDEEALRQILNNLIENAIKYTPAGGRIAIACRDRDGEVELDVSDTGIGIARDAQSRIFERFYQVDRARSPSVEGAGLGLAIVKHIVGSLGGRVLVRSRLNAGSTFTVVLPKVSASQLSHG